MTEIDTALILAGGRGLRLMPDTLEIPKPMIQVMDRPMIEWILLWLRKNHIRRVIIGVDYKKEVLMNYLGKGKKWGLKISYNDHSGAKETGAALRSALTNQKFPDTFLALNSDQLTDLMVNDVFQHHRTHHPIATVVTCPMKSPYGIIQIDGANAIKRFIEKPVLPDLLMNSGIYIFQKSILPYLPYSGAIEKITFPQLARASKLYAYVHRGLFTTINDHKDLREACKILRGSITIPPVQPRISLAGWLTAEVKQSLG